MDIAALGLSVDSGPAERAVTALRQLPGAARAAAAGADQVAGAAERQARATTQSTAALGTNARAMQVSGSAMRAATASVNDNAKAMAGLGFQAKQTLVQLPDIIQGIASGQGVFRTAIQQGGQLVQIYGMGPGGVGGSLRQVGSELAAMITPMRLLGVGVAAIGVAVVAGISSWKNYALALDDLSHITGTATTELSKLQTAASIKGISQDDFAGGMRRFADAVYDARAGTNDLATLLRLNGKTVSDTAGTLDTVANLVRRAGDDQKRLQILQQAGLPATMEWVRLLSSGADGLRAAKEEASKFGGALNDEMVQKAREFDEAWNRAWTNFGISMRRTVVEGYDLLNRLIELGREAVAAFDKATGGQGLSTVGANLLKSGYGTPLSQNTGQLYGGLMAGQGGAGNDNVRDAAWLAQQQRIIQLEQQRISLLGEAATASDRRRQVELQLQAAQLSGINLTEDQKNKIRELAAEERSLAETQKALSVLGASANDDERYAARMQELGIALKHNVINQEQFNRAALDAHPIFGKLKSGMEEFTASMVEGFAKGEDMVDVLEWSLASLGSQLIRMGSQNLIGSLFQGIGGNGQQTGGLLGGGLSSMLGLGSLAGPIGGGLALAAGAAISFFSQSKQDADQAAQAAAQAAQQIAEAQKQWASMAGQVSSWMVEWTTGFAGELSNAIESARSQMQQFANAANEARDPAGVAAVQEAFNRGVTRSIQEAITALQNYGIEQSEVARQIEDVNNKATDLKNVMIQFGVAAEDAAMIVDTQLNAALERLRNNFLDDLVRKVNELAGGAWINQLTDLVDEVAQLRADAAALGIQTALIDEYYVRAAQNIINENQLVGSAFDAVAATLGPLGAGLHEFSAAAEEAAQALKRSAQEIASTIQSYQDQLFIAQQDSSTLSGALAIFDLQAQRAREQEIAAGGEALVALEALQAQQRLNIILDFQRRAAEAERQRLEEERRLREQAAEQARRALEEAQQFLEGAARRISEYISNLLAGSQSPLSPAARLAQAQGDFATQKALALGGDRDALSGITGYAQNIIDAAKAQYGSSADFQTIFNDLIAQLQTLPTQVSPEQFIVDNLTPPLTDITTSVSDQTDAMQTLFANLQSAVNSGSASAIASALLPVFNSIDTNTDNALTFAEMQSALGATYSTGTLRSIFTELDGNGNGILEKSELIKTATTTTGTNTGTTSTNTANMPQMANNISTMNGYSLTTSQATANTVTALGGTSGSNYPATLVNVLSAINSAGYINGGLLDRIRSNLVEQNLNWGDGYATSPTSYLQGQPITAYAVGGYVDGPSHYYGGRNINVEGGEYVVNKRDTARFRGMLDQINFGHSAPTNDNGALISRINALLAEMKKNTNVNAAGAEHVREGVDAIAGALAESARREKLTA